MKSIRIVVFKNSKNPSDSKQILIETSMNKESLLSTCSGALGIKAKKIFTENGKQVTSADNITEGSTFYISQGEDFLGKIPSQSKSPKSYVVCMLGTAAVGKSAVTQRFVQNKFLKDYDPTIEDYYKKVVNLDGESISLSILDTAGMEDYYPLIDD